MSSFAVGPLTIHLYALCIIMGVAVAIWLGDKRYRAFGGNQGVVTELAIWVVPAGVIGGRLYHVVTSPENFFGSKGSLISVVKIWEGGLGIWGAIALGFAVAFWRYKRLNLEIPFSYFMDSLAPGLLIAQGIGRFGNWFNGELFGRPTNLPWGLEIPLTNRPVDLIDFATFHPTFLYEALWCFLIAIILFLFKAAIPGQTFWLYVSLYSFGRAFIESLRSDYSHLIFGIRFNIWIAALFAVLGAWQYFKLRTRRVE